MTKKEVIIIYRKVNVSEKPPEIDKPVIAIYESGETFRAVLSDNGYWFCVDECSDCDEPDYWMEEIELPTEEDIKNDHILIF